MPLGMRKTDLLREYVDYTCEECKMIEGEKRKDKKITSRLQPHRLKRGCEGGTYEHRNVKMVCSICHRMFHPGGNP